LRENCAVRLELVLCPAEQFNAVWTHLRQLVADWSICLDDIFQAVVQIVELNQLLVALATTDVTGWWRGWSGARRSLRGDCCLRHCLSYLSVKE